jgi:hypothetical protein
MNRVTLINFILLFLYHCHHLSAETPVIENENYVFTAKIDRMLEEIANGDSVIESALLSVSDEGGHLESLSVDVTQFDSDDNISVSFTSKLALQNALMWITTSNGSIVGIKGELKTDKSQEKETTADLKDASVCRDDNEKAYEVYLLQREVFNLKRFVHDLGKTVPYPDALRAKEAYLTELLKSLNEDNFDITIPAHNDKQHNDLPDNTGEEEEKQSIQEELAAWGIM